MRRRRGVALLMALTLLAVLGIAVAGGLASTVAVQRTVTLAQGAAVLDAAADRAAVTVLGDPNAYGLATLRLGEARAFGIQLPGMPDIVSEVGVTRVASGVLWIVGAASLKGDTTASRRVSLVARYPSIGRLPAAPIVTGGRVTLGAGVRFTADTSRDADCAVGSGASVIIAPGGAAQVPSGVRVDTAALARDSATYFLTGPQVAALASASGVVRVAGDTTIEGGSLDGILVVGGSLTLRGTFAGSGLIIVRGAIDAADAVVTMRGALLAYAAPPNVSTIFTDLSVEYAPCVVARAVRVALPPRAVRLRSWAELF